MNKILGLTVIRTEADQVCFYKFEKRNVKESGRRKRQKYSLKFILKSATLKRKFEKAPVIKKRTVKSSAFNFKSYIKITFAKRNMNLKKFIHSRIKPFY